MVYVLEPVTNEVSVLPVATVILGSVVTAETPTGLFVLHVNVVVQLDALRAILQFDAEIEPEGRTQAPVPITVPTVAVAPATQVVPVIQDDVAVSVSNNIALLYK